MGLSKHYLDINDDSYRVDFDTLGKALEQHVPEIEFACIMGSAAEKGLVKSRSDLDLAVYLKGKPCLDIIEKVQELCEDVVGPVRCDIGFLRNAEPVYRFEALKGRLLFTRDDDLWFDFYSLTCREYETQMVHYERQRRYRMEACCDM
jgi:predicted nucleotidyltransferase